MSSPVNILYTLIQTTSSAQKLTLIVKIYYFVHFVLINILFCIQCIIELKYIIQMYYLCIQIHYFVILLEKPLPFLSIVISNEGKHTQNNRRFPKYCYLN